MRWLPLFMMCLLVACTSARLPQNPQSAVTEDTVHTHHAFDYVEMSSPDLEGQRDFYAAAFGMSFTAYGPDYLGMSMGDREIGGLERGAFRGAGGPLVVLYSEDIDATLASIEGAGGRITQPITPFPGGRRLHFVDPAGYELAVWSAPASD